MPADFLYRNFIKAGQSVLPLCLAFLVACQSAAEKDSAAFKRDAQASSQIARINDSIGATGGISPENFAALKTIREKYPRASDVRQTYKNALVVREDWAALENFFAETPLAELSAEDRRTLGQVLVKRGRYGRAVEVLKPLADANPQDVETRSLLGVSYFYLDRLDEAGAQFDEIRPQLEAGKRWDEMTLRGIIFLRRNELEKAVETLEKAIGINPSNAAAANALSQAFARLGDAAQAENYRLKTEALKKQAAGDELRARQQVQQIYALENAWKAKNYAEVVERASGLLEQTAAADRKIVLYQYLFESYTALGRRAEAETALAEARKLQQQK